MRGAHLEIFTGEEVAPLEVMRDGAVEWPPGLVNDVASVASGIRTRVQYLGEASDYSVVTVDLAPGAIIPPHSHSTDCLYLVVAGEIELGKRTIGPGGGFFVSSDQTYGYRAGHEGAQVTEVRTSKTFASRYQHLERPGDPRFRAAVANARAHAEEWSAYFDTSDHGR